MTESKMIDLDTVIGVYGLTNTGSVLVHAIDYGEEKILASINGENPEWCRMTEQYVEHLEEETLDWYGKHQPESDAVCPRCGERMDGPTARHALSRRAHRGQLWQSDGRACREVHGAVPVPGDVLSDDG